MKFTIEAFNKETVESRVENINKIAARINADSIACNFSEVRRSYVKSLGVYKSFIDVEIIGTYPKINNWVFVAQLDHVTKMVYSYDDKRYSGHVGDCSCDHCNTNRPRNTTYVIRNTENGKEMHVGGSCLKYYAPTKTLTDINNFYRSFATIGEFDTSGSNKYCINTVTFLAYCLMTVELDGAYLQGETKIKSSIAMNSPKMNAEYREMFNIEEYMNKAIELIDWTKTLEITNDYTFNLVNACSLEYISVKEQGIVCSAIVSYQKAKAVARENEVKSQLPASEHIGTVKKREIFELTVESVIVSEGYYGTTFITRFRDADNNAVIWFGSKRLRDSEMNAIEEGTTVTVKATVKKHDEYKDEKQTVVTRVAVL